MHEGVDRLPAGFVSADRETELAREFEARLLECATVAFRVAFSVLRHREDAEDVAQDAFAHAHRTFRQLRDREKFKAWIVRMVWRLALDRRRSERRRQTREQYVASPLVTEPAQADERAAQLWQAIDALPDKLRIVVVLAGIEGHDMREVSSVLGIPQGTVKSRLHEARQRMREFLS